MDNFKKHSSKEDMGWDVFDTMICWDSKERSKDKHILRKLSRARIKREDSKDIKEII